MQISGTGSNTIDLIRLKAVVERLLDEAIEENGSAQFELSDNLYWQIAFAKQFDMSSTPVPDEVGSLRDDWEFTHGIPDVPTKVSARSLTEVSPILAYIGHKLAARYGRTVEP